MKKLVIILASVSLVLGACSKKDRDVRFAQGQGEDLVTVDSFDGKKEVIITGEAYTDVESKSSSGVSKTDININAKNSQMQTLPLVKYKVQKSEGQNPQKSLLDDKSLLRGRPNFKYEALYKVTDSFLKIYKVGKAEDIDINEQTYDEDNV